MGVRTQCPYCGVGCGLELFAEGENVKVMGDGKHTSSMGDVCMKPLSLPRVLREGRITAPRFRARKDEPFREISWNDALDILSDQFRVRTKEQLYFYLSGQMLTEESYLFNKFAKGFLGTNNIDANSRLCMASAVNAYKLAFGSDGVPCSYDDIDDADAFIFAGSNAAWAHPVLFRRVLSRRKSRKDTLIVTIDPVRTETAAKSDRFIQINAATDTVLFSAVLFALNERGLIDKTFIAKHTQGFEEALLAAASYPPHVAARICGIEESDIEFLVELFAKSEKLLSFWCQGLNQSNNGVAKNSSLINLHLATGRLNARGAPFSLTGQPNAMGGREVGYLANGLPGYRDVRNAQDREYMECFWSLPHGHISAVPGATITQAIDKIVAGEITFFWSVCTNPLVTLPHLSKVKEALLSNRVFVVAQEAYENDTTAAANLVLPALQWSEKEGCMTGADRTVTHCAPIGQPPSYAKADWEIVCLTAKRLKAKGFDFKDAKSIFKEYKESTKGRLCDVSEFSYAKMPMRYGGRWLYENLNFPTPSGKAQFQRTLYEPPSESVCSEFPIVLTSGRTKKQWHTMTRTGKSSHLLKDEERPYLLICEEDAALYELEHGSLAKVTNSRGSVVLSVKVGEIKKGHAFAPFGYPSEYGTPLNVLFSDETDPISRQPQLKYAAVKIELL